MSARGKVWMLTYGYSAESLPPLLHEATSLAAAGYAVESVHGAAIADLTEEPAPGFVSRRCTGKVRALARRLFGPAPPRVVAVLQHALSYVEFTVRGFLRGWRARADVYEAHDLPALLPTVLAARLRGRPVIYRAHEIFSETHARVAFARFWRGLDRLLVPWCDEVVTPDEHRSRIYRDEFGARRRPLTVRNCPPYQPAPASTRLREELTRRGIAADTIVLYQGLVDSMRCIEEIAEATRSFDPGVVLVVLGHGFGAWADPAARLRSHDRIVVLPRVPYDELASYTASADLGILLYRNDCRNNYYCAPNKLFEYMMAGLPIVAPSYPGMVPLVEGEDVGLCVDPARPAEIAGAVNRLARDPAARRRMAENGLRLARDRYCWQLEFRPRLERYEALTSRAPRLEPRALRAD